MPSDKRYYPMSKGEVHVLQSIAQAIMTDYLSCYPSDTLEVERDIQRLSLAGQTRGLATYLLDLPALGKHFDKCLANGSLVPSGLPLGKARWNTSAIPKLFSGLLMRVFDRNSGSLRLDCDVTVIKFLRQIYFFAKGYKHECSPRRSEKAVEEFYAIEREVLPPSLNWHGDETDFADARRLSFDDLLVSAQSPSWPSLCHVGTSDSVFLSRLQYVCDSVVSVFREWRSDEWSGRHGPGAVSDLGRTESKYSFPNWSAKLDRVFPYSEYAFLHYQDWVDNIDHPPSDSEPPSKLLKVWKTAKGPRLIASEPTAHQWCQQAILAYLLKGIQETSLRYSISLNDQNPSRAMVLTASHSRSHATIDLSAASDRVSCWLVERAFRRNKPLLEAFHASRSRYITNNTHVLKDKYHERVQINKFTTMGSACTFPVQSILFALVAISVRTLSIEQRRSNTKVSALRQCDGGTIVHGCSSGLIREAARQVRVFGDDIIVPTEDFDAVTRALSILGLKVNHDKSFAAGNFRESCGMDAWGGFDVTPAHLNACPDPTRPATLIAVVDASNNFFNKGYWHTAAAIESTLPHWVRKNLPVVARGSGKVGFESYCGADTSRLKYRWNPFLQKEEVRVTKLKSKVARTEQPARHDLFQYFTEKPGPETIWSPGRVHESSVYLTLGWEARECLV